MDRGKTGVAGLDTMLNGGLLPARPYVVSGPTGSGKTILAVQFLLDGLRQQEPCLLVTLDEPPIEVKANMATFTWNLDRLKILDATPDIRAHKRQRSVIDVGTSLDVRDMEDVTEIRQSSQIRALEVTVHSVQKMIKQEFSHHLERTKQRYKRVVIDSMTALKMFAMQGQDSRILIQSFVRFLAELEATTLIISERLNKKILETEFFLARGEVRLHKWIDGSVIRRAISIDKFRGSSFDDRMHPISIGDNGMVVYLDAPAQTRVSSPAPKPGESLLETRLIDEVSNVIESIMRHIEDAQRRQVPIRDIEVTLSRAMPVRSPRRAPERTEDQHAGIPLELGRPRRPRCELRYPTVRAHADPRDFHGRGAREDAIDRGADPEDPRLREQGSHGPLLAATPKEPLPEEKLRARRDRFDDGPQIFLHARVRGDRDDAVVHAVPRGIEGHFAAHPRAPGGRRGPSGGVLGPRGAPAPQAPGRDGDQAVPLRREVQGLVTRRVRVSVRYHECRDRHQHGLDAGDGALRPDFRGSPAADVNAAFVRQLYDYF